MCARTCVAGCMGFVYFNATSGAKAMLHLLLREKLRQLTFSKPHLYNDQHILNKGITRVRACYLFKQSIIKQSIDCAGHLKPHTSYCAVSCWRVGSTVCADEPGVQCHWRGAECLSRWYSCCRPHRHSLATDNRASAPAAAVPATERCAAHL